MFFIGFDLVINRGCSNVKIIWVINKGSLFKTGYKGNK